jgi:hypothetical protein
MAMMRCPQCGKTGLKKVEYEEGFHMECRSCGWGRPDESNPRADPNLPPTWPMLMLRWLLVAVILCAPYFALQLGIDEALKKTTNQFQLPVLYYAGVMLVYLLIALFINPIPDHGELGLWGTMRDNPLTYRDNINRRLLFWKVVLTPGKFVIDTAWKTGEKLFHSDRQDDKTA